MEQARIDRSILLDFSVGDAWQRLVFGFSDWFGAGAALDARVGGRVTSGSRVGQVTELHEGSLLRWEWSADGDPGWTEVEITLHAAEDGTEVRVTEILHEWEHVTYHAVGAPSSPGPTAELAVSVR